MLGNTERPVFVLKLAVAAGSREGVTCKATEHRDTRSGGNLISSFKILGCFQGGL